MQVMIVEDDTSTAMLLERLIKRIWANSSVYIFNEVSAAFTHWRENSADLLLVDMGLPGVGGMALLEQIHRIGRGKTIPVIVSGHANRSFVIEAHRYGVRDYIVKPFSAKALMTRLSELMATAKVRIANAPHFESFVAFIEHHLQANNLSLPMSPELAHTIETLEREHKLNKTIIVKNWELEPAFVGRFIGAANTGSYNNSMRVIDNFKEAVEQLGTTAVTNLAIELSLHPGSELTLEPLQTRAAQLYSHGKELAAQVTGLAKKVDCDGGVCRAAAVLHGAGDLALLQLIQAWHDDQHPIDVNRCDQWLASYRTNARDQLGIQWHLPLDMRRLINAIDQLPEGAIKVDMLLVRIAALMLADDTDQEELKTLRERAGLSK